MSKIAVPTPQNREDALAALTIVFCTLHASLAKAALEHPAGEARTKWLNETEAEATKFSKGSYMEGRSIEDEARGFGIGLDFVSAAFAQVRAKVL